MRTLAALCSVAAVANACSASDSSVAPADAALRDASLACRESLADYCLEPDVACQWPADATSFCPIHATSLSISIGTCGPYRLLLRRGVDTARFDYYDAGTGELVAAVTHLYVGDSVFCDAGPTSFVEPCADTITRDVDCTDGGPGGNPIDASGFSFGGPIGSGGRDGGP